MKHQHAIRLLGGIARVQRGVEALVAMPGSAALPGVEKLSLDVTQIVASARLIEQAAFKAHGTSPVPHETLIVVPARSVEPVFPVEHPVVLAPGEAAPPALTFDEPVPDDASAGVQE